MNKYLLALDAGTTSNRAIVFTPTGKTVATAQRPLVSSYPDNGWVEQDPENIWLGIHESAQEVLTRNNISAQQILAVGIANQRETTLIWERATGRPIYPAIVWQDRRTSAYCARLKEHEPLVQDLCGLLLDPYFSASKINWILDHVGGARRQAKQGKLCFGTVDSWLIWQLTGGREHVIEATNASRTALFNIQTQAWDTELMKVFDIPADILPRVVDSVQNELSTDASWLGNALPIAGIAGDQQAALIGQNCVVRGMLKATYGTGGFVMLNTGQHLVRSHNRLLSTLSWRIDEKPYYALEGSIFNVGTSMQWLGETLGLFDNPQLTADLAAKANPNSRVIFVPAFTGIGAPYWDSEARGLLTGVTRDTGIAELVHAALMATMFQTRDLLDSMEQSKQVFQALRVDGGVSKNDWLCQCLADGLQLPIERPMNTEITAWGAAVLAMLGIGHLNSLQEAGQLWSCAANFEPKIPQPQADDDYARWQDAVARTLTT